MWDVPGGKLLWRDDALVHDKDGFAQVMLSSDGALLAVTHDGKLFFREAQTGKITGTHAFPAGTKLGQLRVFNGHTLVLGDSELFAFRDGAPLWKWSTPAEITAQAFAPDGVHWCIGDPAGAIKLMEGGAQVGGYKAPSGAISGLSISADGSRVGFATATGWVGVVKGDGECRWQRNVGSRATIALNADGPAIVGDWRGIVRRFDPTGQELWRVDLTPHIYRDDLATVLTAADPTPALVVPPPPRHAPPTVEGKVNLALKATITHVPARSGGWRHRLQPQKGGGAVLNNGQADDITLPWYDDPAVNEMLGSTMEDHPAWELSWPQPIAVQTLIVRESPRHPEAVPAEIAVHAWVEENGLAGWREIIHDYWNSGTSHAHPLGGITTRKLRYIAHGDLGNNLWTSEIEVYAP